MSVKLSLSDVERMYAQRFETECANKYREIDAFEERCGAAVSSCELELAARTLACPLKQNPPNWQHGRVIYAALFKYAYPADKDSTRLCVDIGTAKGFSALIMAWALFDAGCTGRVVSLDVVDPLERAVRNSVAELKGLLTVPEFVAPWPESKLIEFRGGGAAPWLSINDERIHFAYVDGKHTYEAVKRESTLIAPMQCSGDIIVFDDMQVPGVARAVSELHGYAVEHLTAIPGKRAYAVAVKQ